MNNITTRRFEMFVRVRDFCAERVTSFPANSLGGEQLAEVRSVVGILAEMAASQSARPDA